TWSVSPPASLCRGASPGFLSAPCETASPHACGHRGPCAGRTRPARRAMRSEEHTSELQSRVDLVCRLLLEKKKKKKNKNNMVKTISKLDTYYRYKNYI